MSGMGEIESRGAAYGAMDSSAVEAFFRRVGDLFTAKRFEELARLHVVPLILYPSADQGREVLVLDTEDRVRSRHEAYHAALAKLGRAAFEPRVVNIEAAGSGRLRADVRWTQRGARGAIVARTLVRYFLIVDDDGKFLIEMLEQTEDDLGAASRAH